MDKEAETKKIHFVGCEGVSMKTLSALMAHKGHIVTGSDLSLSGHDAKNVEGADLVVYTAAVHEDNPERQRAAELNIPQISRGEMLGRICSMYGFSIAVSGAHGKTTTTGMLWEALKSLNPTVHIGGTYGGKSCGIGGDEIFITEACEYQRSFLHLCPDIAMILNVDLDHTDCYKDLSDMNESFALFASRAKRLVVVNGDEFPKTDGVRQRIVTVGFGKYCDYYATCLSPDKYGRYSFCVQSPTGRLGRISLSVAGRHNIYNALFTVAACIETASAFPRSPLTFGRIAAALSEFKGAQRRMELLGFKDGCTIFSDYAHHPKEITMTVLSVKESRYKHITAVFEPHTYTRTQSFYKEFAESLSPADTVVLLPVYAAREARPEGVSSALIGDELRERGVNTVMLDSYGQAAEFLNKNLKDDGVILFMGAGTIDILARDFAAPAIK